MSGQHNTSNCGQSGVHHSGRCSPSNLALPHILPCACASSHLVDEEQPDGHHRDADEDRVHRVNLGLGRLDLEHHRDEQREVDLGLRHRLQPVVARVGERFHRDEDAEGRDGDELAEEDLFDGALIEEDGHANERHLAKALNELEPVSDKRVGRDEGQHVGWQQIVRLLVHFLLDLAVRLGSLNLPPRRQRVNLIKELL